MKKLHKLNSRQEELLRFLEERKDVFTTIEEVCVASITNSKMTYKYNVNDKKHDKCILLSDDVRKINRTVNDPNKIIIKDEFGSVKLINKESEFNDWYSKEIRKVTKKFIYLNDLYEKVNKIL